MRNLRGRLRAPLRGRFARNWSLLVISSFAGQLLGMLATIRVARLLAPEGYGQYNLVQTVAALGAVVASLGFRNVVIRECARKPELSGRLLWVTAAWRAGMMAIVGVGIAAYARYASLGLSMPLTGVAVGLLVGLSGWELVENIAFGRERMEFSSGINLGGSILWTIAVWIVPAGWLTPLNVSLGFASLQLAKAASYGYMANALGFFKGGPVGPTLGVSSRSLLSQSLPFYWLALMTMATSQLPILFLAARSGAAEVGLYNAGYRLISPMQMLLATAFTALFPSLALAGSSDPHRFLMMIRQALTGIVLLGTVAALAIGLLRSEVVLLLFGTAYKGTADAIAYQSWYTVLLAVYSLIGASLAATDKQQRLALLSTGYALISTPILWWGAVRGATGLAAAILLAALLSLSYHWIVFQRSLPVPLKASQVVLLLGTLAGGFGMSWIVPQGIAFPWRLLIASSLLILLAILTIRLGLMRSAPGTRLEETSFTLPAG